MAAETTPAIERGAEAVEPYIAATAHPRDAVCAEAARGVLAAALNGSDGGDARVKVIHDAVCDGRSMDDCDGLCGAAFDALRASILGGAR